MKKVCLSAILSALFLLNVSLAQTSTDHKFQDKEVPVLKTEKNEFVELSKEEASNKNSGIKENKKVSKKKVENKSKSFKQKHRKEMHLIY